MKTASLMYVDGLEANSNKFYDMVQVSDSEFRATWGRYGQAGTSKNYPMKKWDSTLREKIKKGYSDMTHLKEIKTVTTKLKFSNNTFEEFYRVFSRYTSDQTKKHYIGSSCTPTQLKEAQSLLDELSTLSTVDDFNKRLMMLFKVIPRQMDNVKRHIITDVKDINTIIQREQDALDSMGSSNIINDIPDNEEKDFLDSLGIEWEEVVDVTEMNTIDKLIMPTNSSRHRIKKVYKVRHKTRAQIFQDWLAKQNNQSAELLIHGTRNANIFSILKQGLLIRPSNAAYIAGNAYGNGIYHSAHTDKSLGYTGHDNDKLFLIQEVHMGNPFTYDGWYRGNSFSLEYNELKKRGYDSTYVKPGNGLRNSEYIVYRTEQTHTKYLVWLY